MLYSESSELTSLSKHWWFHFGKALSEVVMPEDFYKVGPIDGRKLDDVGFNAMARFWNLAGRMRSGSNHALAVQPFL